MMYAGSEKEQASIITEKASKSMKNQKSVGEDGLHAEYVKYGPPEIHNGIATLLNTIARCRANSESGKGIRRANQNGGGDSPR